MDEERNCSIRWPQYSLYIYTGLSVLAGGATMGTGIYLMRLKGDITELYASILSQSFTQEFDLMQFIYLSAMVVGVCMILTSVSLGVCGVYKMNRSCVAAYVTSIIFAFCVSAAVGLTVVSYESKFLTQIGQESKNKITDEETLERFIKFVMIITLVLSAFQLVGVILTCCLQKAIEDVQKS